MEYKHHIFSPYRVCPLGAHVNHQQDFELEAYNEDSVKNKAHQIIYQQVYSQLNNLFSRKAELKSQCESIYKEAYDKYKL